MAVCREIIFTKTPLKHAYRCGDTFQLIPYADDNGPEITKYVVDYPCFLEYSLPLLKDGERDLYAELSKEREICVLLTAFSTNRFFVYDIHASSWGVKTPLWGADAENAIMGVTGSQLNDICSQKSEFYYSGFYYKGKSTGLLVDGFTKVDDEKKMRLMKSYSSYIYHEQDRYDIRYDAAELILSDETSRCFDSYYALSERDRAKVFAAARLITDCIALKDYRYSLSFLACVAALEALADIANGEDNQVVEDCKSCHAIKTSPYTCPECGRPIWGVATKVKSFLKQYVSSKEQDIANYNKIYNLRSMITHTGDIFTKDSIFHSTDKQEEQEFKMGYMLIAYARKAMIKLMLSLGQHAL